MAMEVVLETKNLCKSFGAVMVNDKINLTLHRGEIMGVLGENGSGKIRRSQEKSFQPV